jgi:cell division protein ZapA
MNQHLDISFLGKDYRVACEPGERELLQNAVSLLKQKLQEIGDKTRSSGERLAVMAALDLAHELVSLRATPTTTSPMLDSETIQRRINLIEARVTEALKQSEELF